MEYKNVLSVCPYCGAGCALHLQVLDGRLAGVLPVKNHVIGQGGLCVKGWNAHAFVHHPDRLNTPLVRQGEELVPAEWNEALEMVAQKLETISRESGAGAVGFLASAKCTNEENYLLQKLARAVIGTNNIDHCARL